MIKEWTIDLVDLLPQAGDMTGGKVNLLKRETGRLAREALAGYLAEYEEEAAIYLDFNRIGVIDYSCADEFLGKLLPRLLADEFGRKYLCLRNVSSSQKENVSVALEKRNVAVVAVLNNSDWTYLGKLNPYLQKTLDLVYKHRRISARELSDLLKLSLNTGSTRLINLYKRRLVGREENLSHHASREFIYTSLVGGFGFA